MAKDILQRLLYLLVPASRKLPRNSCHHGSGIGITSDLISISESCGVRIFTMKIKVLKRNPEDYVRESKHDINRNYR